MLLLTPASSASGAREGGNKRTKHTSNLDSAEVHGFLDDLEVVGDAQLDRIDRLVEDPSVLVVFQGLETVTRSIHKQGRGDGQREQRAAADATSSAAQVFADHLRTAAALLPRRLP
jgi:hypothetical protein